MSGSSEPPTCRILFEGACLAGVRLQDEVFKNYPNGECEATKVSSFSPCPVDNNELLTRLIIHPIHYDEQKQQVSPMAFQEATTMDLSVFRELRATDAEVQHSIDQVKITGKARTKPQERFVFLVMQALTSDIRNLAFEDLPMPMCRVYDTAIPTNRAHASVFTPICARKGSRQRQVRRALLELFSLRQMDPEEYRPLEY